MQAWAISVTGSTPSQCPPCVTTGVPVLLDCAAEWSWTPAALTEPHDSLAQHAARRPLRETSGVQPLFRTVPRRRSNTGDG